jgi:hypothetical protein
VFLELSRGSGGELELPERAEGCVEASWNVSRAFRCEVGAKWSVSRALRATCRQVGALLKRSGGRSGGELELPERSGAKWRQVGAFPKR